MVVVRKLVGKHPTERIARRKINKRFSVKRQLVKTYKVVPQEWLSSDRGMAPTSNPLRTRSHLAPASRGRFDPWVIPRPPIVSRLAFADRRD